MRQCQDSSDSHKQEKKIKARTFVELITHVEHCVEGGKFYFKLVHELYENCLLELGISKEINRVHFKGQLLKYFCQVQEQSDLKNVILVCEQGMQEMLKQALKCDSEGDTVILAKAAKIVRDDIFDSIGFNFNASFPSECQQH